MNKADFYYDLPKRLIAQSPCERRDESRMMYLRRDSDDIGHLHFYDLPKILNEGDLLVVNDTRVLPARLYATKRDTGARVEFLLLSRESGGLWQAIVKPGKRARQGASFDVEGGLMEIQVQDVLENGNRLIRIDCDGDFYQTLDKIGQTPLPPYITEQLEDKERYQTVYSRRLGSAAAPTAGLHFTNELMQKLREKGVKFAEVTLHVGLGTFRPVKEQDITKHNMHSEHYVLPEQTAKMINETKAAGGRVIAVGTTSCRTLESVANKYREIRPSEGDTDIFIYPGYEFKCIDGLITNFHLPESTLIMLVSAFYGHEKTIRAYNAAVLEEYRFFSFGDCCLIL